MTTQRTPLTGSIHLCRENDPGKHPVVFHIDEEPAMGADVISYFAHHDGSGKGILKEFYPDDESYLQRNEDGQLFFDEQAVEHKKRFSEEVNAYLASMQKLQQLKVQRQNQDLENFIPEFEVFRGLLADGSYADGYYVWNPSSKVMVFDEFCRKFSREFNKHGLYLLAKGIKIIRALTRDLKILHEEGLVHRDIKPQNFGCSYLDGHILTDHVTLFDINSVIQIGDPVLPVGTPGYSEPEYSEAAGNLTDIYSIGAVLYHFLFSSQPDYNGQGFDPDALLNEPMGPVKTGKYMADLMNRKALFSYELLDQKIHELPFMALLPEAEQKAIGAQLTKILTGCLARREQRYACCEDLLEDLDYLVFLTLKYGTPSDMLQYQKWELVDQNKKLEEDPCSMEQVLISHLWNHPLYKWNISAKGGGAKSKKDKKERKKLQVVIVGFGKPAQKYLDLVLQAGQIPGWPVQVQVLTDDPGAVREWKDSRPALPGFFTIDGKNPPVKESYGTVNFTIVEPAVLKDPDQIKTELRAIRAFNGQSIFLDLGSDRVNEKTAEKLEEQAKSFKLNPGIAWVSWKLPETVTTESAVADSENTEDRPMAGIPVFIHQNIPDIPEMKQLDQLTLNIHLLYVDNLAQDFKNTRQDLFEDQYNYTASLRAAFSVKYKLFSMGIDLDEQDLEQSLQQLKALEQAPNARALRDRQICYEHRRWVCEKACDGWQCLSDLYSLKGDATKNNKEKRHICLVDCQESSMLGDIPATPEAWNRLSETQLAAMDELDQLSVRLHRMYQDKADQLQGQNFSEKPLLSGMEFYVTKDRDAHAAYMEWKHCIQEIEKGHASFVKQYKPLKDMFLRSLGNLPEEVQDSVKLMVKSFDQLFYPVCGSVKCRDFRQSDAAIVDHLDFVLSYDQDLCLGIPWKLQGTDPGDGLMDMIASTLIIAPATTAFFVELSDEWYARNRDFWQDEIAGLARFMNHKNLRTQIELVLFASEETAEEVKSHAENVLGNKRLNNVVRYDNILGTHAASLRKWLKERKDQNQTFILEKNHSRLFGYLAGGGLYDEYPNFELDSIHRRFTSVSGCNVLNSIHMLPSLSVGDLGYVHGTFPKAHHQPEYYHELEALSERYFRDPKVWKVLCSAIEDNLENARGHEVAFVFKNEADTTRPVTEYTFVLPVECQESMDIILRKMIENKLAEKSSSLRSYTSEEVILNVKSSVKLDGFFEFLLRKPHRLFSPRYLSVEYDPKMHKLTVARRNLYISKMELSNPEKELSLLNFWQSAHCLYGLTSTKDEEGKVTVSFTLSSFKSRELLANSGRMLEVYVYYKLRQTNAFDDIVSGFEVEWNKDGTYNEFDIIATKGFQTLVIECKARPAIEANHYFKLQSLADRFGVRQVPVLLISTGEQPDTDLSRGNSRQRSTWDPQKITTIWKEEDIRNIGSVLVSLMENR